MLADDRPSLIKLDNGDNIVAIILEQTEQYITVSYPLELVRQEISPTMETVAIRPWASFTDDQEIEIRQQKIVSISNLKQEYVEGYLKMLFQATQEELEVSFDEGQDARDLDDWLDDAEERINSLIDKDDIKIH